MPLIQVDQKYVRKVILPTTERVLGCLALAIILLASPSYYLVTNHLTARIIGQETDSLIHHALHVAGRYPLLNTLAIVIFWGSVALLAYLCYWIIANAATSAYNEVSIDTQYANAGSWLYRLSGPIGKAVFILALMVFLLVSWVVYGKCLVPFTASLANWKPQYLVREILIIATVAIDLYLIRILAVLAFSIS